jgi:hypothetical protein
MTTAYQLLSIVALYSDIANTFDVFDDGVAAGRRAKSGRVVFVAAHPLEA